MEFFKDSNVKLRTYEMNDGMWFALDDVLTALEVARSDIMELEDDIRKLFNGKEWIEVINERGFWYLLLFESHNENAKKFSDWAMQNLTKGAETTLQIMNTVVRSIAETSCYMKGDI